MSCKQKNDCSLKIKKILKEQSDRYMFFSNLEQMRRQCDLLLELERDMVDSILDNGHDWAQDHIAEAKNNLDQVFDFLMNEIEGGKEPEGDMTPAPVDMGGEDNIDEELMEYEDFEDDEDEGESEDLFGDNLEEY